ncbi:MAG: protein-L-isoaspartate(D-aspartate) O-methyltransferase [bacterium]
MKTSAVVILSVLLLLVIGTWSSGGRDNYAHQRLRLIKKIQRSVGNTASITGRPRLDRRVMETMARVPRHLFVPSSYRAYAYRNRPLPIGYGQTISQPTIVALMTDLLEPQPGQVVLEIGTGSGYQAAVLADLGLRVYTMEIIQPLAVSAEARLKRLGYHNVQVNYGDGYHGWEAHAPFDAIIVTAAADHIPPPLVAQLKPGGRMVIPIGPSFMTQQLLLVEKDFHGKIKTRHLLPVAFVPFRRKG